MPGTSSRSLSRLMRTELSAGLTFVLASSVMQVTEHDLDLDDDTLGMLVRISNALVHVLMMAGRQEVSSTSAAFPSPIRHCKALRMSFWGYLRFGNLRLIALSKAGSSRKCWKCWKCSARNASHVASKPSSVSLQALPQQFPYLHKKQKKKRTVLSPLQSCLERVSGHLKGP